MVIIQAIFLLILCSLPLKLMQYSLPHCIICKKLDRCNYTTTRCIFFFCPEILHRHLLTEIEKSDAWLLGSTEILKVCVVSGRKTPLLFPQCSSFPQLISPFAYSTTVLLWPLTSVLVLLESWKSSLFLLISPESSLLQVLSRGLSSLPLTATLHTDPSQTITVPHLYSSFPSSPWFILSCQTFNLSLLFSLLTLNHWLFDQLVLILPPGSLGPSCPGFLQLPSYFSPTPASASNAELWSYSLFTAKGGFLSL